MTTSVIPSKTCTKCHTEKPIEDFCKQYLAIDGLASYCKSCNIIRSKAWRLANPGKVKATNTAWNKANIEKMKVANAAYLLANPEKAKARKANRTKWQKENPEKTRIHRQNRRSRKLENGGKLSQGLAEKLFKLQKGTCPCCNQPLGDNYHLDHITPLSKGGANTDENIQLLRQTCNNQKYNKDPIDFMQSKGFLI